jgi:hypothetical protein
VDHLYGFNHIEAERNFKEAIKVLNDYASDEGTTIACPICYWGLSFANSPPCVTKTFALMQ